LHIVLGYPWLTTKGFLIYIKIFLSILKYLRLQWISGQKQGLCGPLSEAIANPVASSRHIIATAQRMACLLRSPTSPRRLSQTVAKLIRLVVSLMSVSRGSAASSGPTLEADGLTFGFLDGLYSLQKNWTNLCSLLCDARCLKNATF